MLALCHDGLPQLISGFRQHVTGGVQSQHPLAVKEISRQDAIARRDRVDRTAAYSELRLAPGAGGEAVRAAYRSLAKQHHPDIPGGDAGRFQRLKQARDLLLAGSDPAPAGPAQVARRGADISAEVEVPLEVIMTGGRVPVSGAGGVCAACRGTGSSAAVPVT
jgi:DnaJ-class molecular chaperone